MAATFHLCFTPYLSSCSSSSNSTQLNPRNSLPSSNPPFHLSVSTTRSRTSSRILAGNIDLLGDFGARDPFPAEVESNFCENVLGNVNTEHKILIPNATALSLAQQECTPISPDEAPISEEDAKKLLFKVVGWKLINERGLKLQCLWKVRNSDCGAELMNRITKVVEPTGHFTNLHLHQPADNQVSAELFTASIGGLSMNDFIVAAKIDQIKTSDLAPRQRVWA